MARYKSSTFANLRLADADKKKFNAWQEAEQIGGQEVMLRFTGDGFKLSVSWIFDQNAFCLSVIGTDETKDHRDMVMTSWSDDLEEVLLIAAYKHYVMCDGKAWPTNEAGNRWG